MMLTGPHFGMCLAVHSVMIFAATLCILFILSGTTEFTQTVTGSLLELARESHFFCLDSVNALDGHPLARSLICGARVENPGFKNALKQLGLIHLFVVSGLHLQLLHNLLRPWPRLSIFLSGQFTLLCSLKPPVLRAFINSLVFPQLDRYHVPDDIKVFFSSLSILVFLPSWIESISFLLSWFASLCLLISEPIQVPLLRFTFIFLTMSAALIPIGASPILSDPILILVSYIATTLILFLLFPLVFSSLVLPTAPLVSLAEKSLIEIAQIFPSPLKVESYDVPSYLLFGILISHGVLRLKGPKCG